MERSETGWARDARDCRIVDIQDEIHNELLSE